MFLMKASRKAKIGELDVTVRIHEDIVWLDVSIAEISTLETTLHKQEHSNRKPRFTSIPLGSLTRQPKSRGQKKEIVYIRAELVKEEKQD